MFLTQLRQLRLTLSMLQGNRINATYLRQLLADALRTYEEFGASSLNASPLLVNPAQGERGRADYQNHLLARTIASARRCSPYYRSRLPSGFAASRETLTRLPLTDKHDIRTHGSAFLAEGATPTLGARSAGTTGQPVEIWYGRDELEVWSALAALSVIQQGLLESTGCLQLNVHARSAVPFRYFLQWLALGIPLLALGMDAPERSMDSLLRQDMPPTLLVTYPSYLAQLVRVAQNWGIGPADMHLRQIICGSEILSPALAATTQAIFGAPVLDSYGQTETAPFAAQVCRQGHLHCDTNSAFVEVIDLEGEPACAGSLGTLVVTPYYPLRQTMPLIRYQTNDLVRVLSDEPLACELAALPATSPVLGRREHLLTVGEQAITRRELVEAIESLPTRPYPARFMAEVTTQGLVLSLLEQAVAGLTLTGVKEHLQAQGLPVTCVRVWPDDFSFNTVCPQRADRVETAFARGGAH